MLRGFFAAVLAAVFACAPTSAKVLYQRSGVGDGDVFIVTQNLHDAPLTLVDGQTFYVDITATGVNPDWLDIAGVYTDRTDIYAFGQPCCGGGHSPNFFALDLIAPGHWRGSFTSVNQPIDSSAPYFVRYRAALTGGMVLVNNDHANDGLVFPWSITISDGVPEPAAWALMIAGFGLAGAHVRRRPVRAPSSRSC